MTKKKKLTTKSTLKPSFKRPLTKQEELEYRSKQEQRQRKKHKQARDNFIDMLYKKYEN